MVCWNGVVGGSRWERSSNSMETVSMEDCGGVRSGVVMWGDG